jgi:hypothetical protein
MLLLRGLQRRHPLLPMGDGARRGRLRKQIYAPELARGVSMRRILAKACSLERSDQQEHIPARL